MFKYFDIAHFTPLSDLTFCKILITFKPIILRSAASPKNKRNKNMRELKANRFVVATKKIDLL